MIWWCLRLPFPILQLFDLKKIILQHFTQAYAKHVVPRCHTYVRVKLKKKLYDPITNTFWSQVTLTIGCYFQQKFWRSLGSAHTPYCEVPMCQFPTSEWSDQCKSSTHTVCLYVFGSVRDTTVALCHFVSYHQNEGYHVKLLLSIKPEIHWANFIWL